MKKKNLVWNLVIVAAILFVLIVVGGVIAFQFLTEEETVMYFNTGTDLPDNLLSLRPNATSNEIFIGEDYEILFTIIPATTSTYSLIVKSDIYQSTKDLELTKGETKRLSIKLHPTEEDKWSPGHTETQEWHNEIDITANAWLAEKREFAVLMNGSLPAIVQENYNLPISSDIDQFGAIYHIDLSLDELRLGPFTKAYQTTSSQIISKKSTTDEINLKIEGEKLILDAKRVNRTFSTEDKIFSIRLFSTGVEVDESGFRKRVAELSFSYKVI